MPRRDIIHSWQLLFMLLLLGRPLHAQSELGFAFWLPNPGRNEYVHDDFPADPWDSVIEVDNGPTKSKGHPHFAHAAIADTLSTEFTVDFEGLSRYKPKWDVLPGSAQQISSSDSNRSGIASPDNKVGEDSKSSSAPVVRSDNQTYSDHNVYYRGKLEFAFDGGWLPKNIPFVFDVFLGDAYTMTGLRYTLVPLIASLRWHMDDVGGPWIFRGNWDMTFSGSLTLIPRGPETRYFSYDMGIRRNFVPRRGKIAPYFDGQLGLGEINAKEPLGVQFAQGQNFTFTMNLGSGVRYNFNPRYSFSAGLHWMHISNLYLSQPAFSNYGINVYGPMFGIDIRLRKPRQSSE